MYHLRRMHRSRPSSPRESSCRSAVPLIELVSPDHRELSTDGIMSATKFPVSPLIAGTADRITPVDGNPVSPPQHCSLVMHVRLYHGELYCLQFSCSR